MDELYSQLKEISLRIQALESRERSPFEEALLDELKKSQKEIDIRITKVCKEKLQALSPSGECSKFAV